jgi:O-antigen/teichoic acid export membrane protein
MSFLRKAALVNTAEFVGLVLAVLRTAILSRALGPAGIGQYAIILSALLLTPQICCFGMPMSFLYHSQQDSQNTKRYLINALISMLFTGAVGGVALALLLFFKASYFGSITWLALTAVGCYVTIILLKVISRNVLLIKIEARKLGLMRVIPMICGILLVLILFALGMLTTSRAIICLVLSELAALLMGLAWIRRHIDFSYKLDWGIIRKLGYLGIRLSWADLMILINAQLTILLVRYLLNNFESVGYFSRGQRIAMLTVAAGQAIMPLLFSRWASLAEERLAINVEKVMRFASTVSVIAIVGLLLTGKWIVLILYGREFLPAVKPMMILVPGAVLYLLSRTIIGLLGGRGVPELSAMTLLPGTIVNAVLCWFLIPLMDIQGAACASTASNIVLLLLFMLIIKRKYSVRIRQCVFLRKSDLESLLKEVWKRKK